MAPLRSGQQAACGWPGRAAVVAAGPLCSFWAMLAGLSAACGLVRRGGREQWPKRRFHVKRRWARSVR